MRSTLKASLAGIVAAAALAASVGGASANTLGIDDLDYRIVWPELTFTGDAGEAVRCPSTFSGTFHEDDFGKVADTLVGHVTHANLDADECEGGSASIQLGTLPWHVRFDGFAGTLPNITAIVISVVDAGMAIQNEVATCLGRTSASEPLFLVVERNVANGRLTQVIPTTDTIDVNDVGAGISCDFVAGDGMLGGTGALDDTNGNQLVLTLNP